MKTVLKANKRYVFSDYFNMNHPTDEIVSSFGYSFMIAALELPHKAATPESAQRLIDLYYAILPRISMTSEMAKREFLIAPMILELAQQTEAKINVEYPLNINEQLGGSLDYLLRSEQELIVIEAKNKDLDGGFNQLATEMIALDKYNDTDAKVLYGAVTVGDIWRFGILQREQKTITKDLHAYTIPRDTQKIFESLLGIVG